jgi:hypothetical protein
VVSTRFQISFERMLSSIFATSESSLDETSFSTKISDPCLHPFKLAVFNLTHRSRNLCKCMYNLNTYINGKK